MPNRSTQLVPNETTDEDSNTEILRTAREVVAAEGRAVVALADELGAGFLTTVQLALHCRGRVVLSGMGKSGLVAQKIAATLASTATPALFLHAAEAVHGDLGLITRDDMVIALSNSGESEEILRLLRPLKRLGVPLVAMVGECASTLAQHADAVIGIGNIAEACPMGLVPTASTTAMMVVGDALAMTLFQLRGLGPEEYAQFHPGGSLGRKLMRVEEVMRRGKENPVVSLGSSLRQVIAVMTQTPGRPGAASVVDNSGTNGSGGGRFVGVFTDGDLRRLLGQADFSVDLVIDDVLHRDAKTVRPDTLVVEAERMMREHSVDQVPVVDDDGRPVGLLDVQDLLRTSR